MKSKNGTPAASGTRFESPLIVVGLYVGIAEISVDGGMGLGPLFPEVSDMPSVGLTSKYALKIDLCYGMKTIQPSYRHSTMA